MTVIGLGGPTGSVAPGDTVICDGEYTRVLRVVIHPPGVHPPIVSRMYAGSKKRGYWSGSVSHCVMRGSN